MPHTLATLIPLVQYLAAPGVAGILASLLFAAARRRFPLHATAPIARWQQWLLARSAPLYARLSRWLLTLLYAPLYARLSVVSLAFGIGLAAQVILALLSGQPTLPIIDAALASALAGLVSQFTHAATDLSLTVPSASPGIYAGLQQRLDAEREQEIR